MRHRIAHKHFNRDANHRKALLKNLVRSLVELGEITTTIEKAKELKSLADRMIGQAQTDSLTVRRTLHRFFGRRDAVNTLVERVAPAMKDRKSGFVSISRAGVRRGDSATLATVRLVNKPETVGTLKSGKVFEKPAKVVKAKAVKAPKPAAKKAPAKVKKVAKPSTKKATKAK